jgi:WD40 repeat protein
VEIYELPGGKLLRKIEHRAEVTAIAFGRANRDLVTGAADGSLLLTRDGSESVALPPAAGGIDAAAILPDGRIAASDTTQRLRIYDADSHALVADHAIPMRIGSLRASADSRRLLTVPSYQAASGSAMLWDLSSDGDPISLDGHPGRTFSARFVRGDAEILTTGVDGMMRLRGGITGELRQTFRGGSRYLADSAMTPDGSMVVAGGADGLLRFWDVASGRLLWTMPVHRGAVIGIHFEGGDIVTHGMGGEVSRWTVPNTQVSPITVRTPAK